ncbi:FAS1-like dehydratase domain-containing protein [Brevibacterium luteolum]|uniref:FAS1-like dehydratase domain-containing protein n=1 Tax=Brevibacterium luteolum TaxID=199591 RepID=UPI003EED8E15
MNRTPSHPCAAATTDQYIGWVGRTQEADDVASQEKAERLATLLAEAASGEPPRAETDEPLFPLGHWLQFSEDVALADTGPDGHPALGGFMPPVPGSRRMWAGSSLQFHGPIRPGQKLNRKTTIESITEKSGRSGELVFVRLRHEISADGAPALTDRHTIVYRDAPAPASEHACSTPSAAAPPRPDTEASAGWEWSRSVRPGPVMLFRYSALTFNSHRIHYDHPYTTTVEGYPGLVVHGPLIASLLLRAFLDAHPTEAVTAYEFTARSPLFASEQVHLLGRRTDIRTHELAAIGPADTVVMKAVVTTASAAA